MLSRHAGLNPIVYRDSQPTDSGARGSLVQELRDLYGEGARIFSGAHHARFVDEDVPLHLISRVFQGRHLLRPSPLLNRIVVGVIGRALELYPDVVLYAVAVLSNHFHAIAKGPADQIAGFMGYTKREISRRWGGQKEVDWSDSLWSSRYIATALPTAESQVNALRYVLSQGVKEGLVAKPQLWPGVHCAGPLLSGGKLRGEWLDATAWYRARQAANRRQEGGEASVRKADFIKAYEVALHPIPAWSHLTDGQRRDEVRRMVDEIVEEGRKARNGRGPLGAKAICATPLDRRTELERPPWFEKRRRMICWADPKAPETRAYLDQYWTFQRAFRAASAALRGGELAAEFPPTAFRPVTYHRATAGPA